MGSKLLLSTLIAFVAVVSVSSRFVSFGERIFNGTNAIPKQFPYQVWIWTRVLGQSGYSTCGGSIVSAMHIVSAAHCFSFPRNYTTVYMGLTSLSVGYMYVDNVPPANVKIHERYDPVTFQNDIAVVRLTKAIPFSSLPAGSVAPILLPQVVNGVPQGTNPAIYDNKRVVVSGWGKVNNTAGSSPSNLQYQYMNVMPHASCKRFFAQSNGNITNGQMCTDKSLVPKSGPCQGDSGGPLALNVTSSTGKLQTYLLGATSYIFGRSINGTVECTNTNPAVYTNVAYFLSWIYVNTGLNGTMG